MTDDRDRVRDGNELMAARVLQMPPQPYRDGAYVLRVLEVPGRRSGQPRRVPLAVMQLDGARYLIGVQRTSDWVRNLTAAGVATLLSPAGAERYTARLVEDDAAVAAALAYRSKLGEAGMSSDRWPFPPDVTVEQARPHMGEIGVFRLEPAEGART